MYTIEELYMGKVLAGEPKEEADDEEFEDDDLDEEDDDDDDAFKEDLAEEFPLSGGETDEDLDKALR